MEKVGVVKDSVLVTHWTIMAHLCYLKFIDKVSEQVKPRNYQPTLSNCNIIHCHVASSGCHT